MALLKSLLSFTLFLAAACLSASCSSDQKIMRHDVNQKSQKTQELRHTEMLRDRQRFHSRQDKGYFVRLYELKGRFNWETKKLLATVDISFGLECACQQSIVLDSKVTGIENILLKSTGQVLPFSTQGSELTVDLSSVPEELRKKELVVSIRYFTDSTNLNAVSRLAGDPVASRVVYSFSEPEGASQWMPCTNDPAHRSLISFEFTMPVDETLIANGDLIRNEVVGQERIMKYQTRYTLPNYLMAFALGELNIATTYHGSLPVSIVARRGLSVDHNGLLKETVRQIQAYEKLLTPFPFEKYMVVLLPEFSAGGIEHAGITFNRETGSSDSHIGNDLWLMAHELGHQWFGDLVTVQTWDDLWIKEGMATLLAEEASRFYSDQKDSHRLFGREFEIDEGDAIVDKDLKPEDKYTSGPYGRSAWLLTQIRSYVGEDVFWSTLRKVLQDHRFGAIGTNDFLNYFKPSVGEAFLEKYRRALSAKALPQFEVKETSGVFDLQLVDKEGSIVVPMELRWYSDDGAFETELYTDGVTKQHLVQDRRLLLIDTQDRHALVSLSQNEKAEKDFQKYLLPLLLPKNDTQKKFLLGAGSAHQLNALESDPWNLSAKDFLKEYESVSSESGKFLFLQMACAVAKKETPEKIAEWRKVLSAALSRPPLTGMPVRNTNKVLSECRGTVSENLYGGLLASIENYPANPNRSDAELYFASQFSVDAPEAFRIWTRLVSDGASVRSRAKGLSNLVRQLKGTGAFVKPLEIELGQWRTFFRETLKTAEASEIVEGAVEGIEEMRDTESFSMLARWVHSGNERVMRRAYCAGIRIAKGSESTLKQFEAALGPDPIPTWVKACN